MTVVFLLIAWRHSSALGRDLIAVTERPTTPGVVVRRVGAGRITLEADQPRQDIGHPGVIGLRWQGGYGRVGEVVEVESLRVIRTFEPVKGDTPPLCSGPLQDCPRVDLDPYAYPATPADAGLSHQEVSYQAPLGPTDAWVVPGEGTRWAIHIHGWAADRREAIRLLPALNRSKITSMVIEYRNDRAAPSDPSGRHRFGLTEWADVEAAVDHALGQGAEDLILVGYSTGAAHAMSFLERSDRSSRVAGAVLDSPNVTLADTVRHVYAGSAGPLAASPLGMLTGELGMVIADLRWQIDWEGTDYAGRAADLLVMPTLVFHGTSDRVVPISISRRLEKAAPMVTLVETRAAGHVMSWNADPSRYERHLTSFVEGL